MSDQSTPGRVENVVEIAPFPIAPPWRRLLEREPGVAGRFAVQMAPGKLDVDMVRHACHLLRLLVRKVFGFCDDDISFFKFDVLNREVIRL